MPNTLTGTEAAAAIYAQVRARAARLTEPPCLAAVSVGAQPDDLAYLRSIALSAVGCGVTVRPVPLPADCAPETLTDTLRALSADDGVHGVLLLRPLPAALRAQEILDALDARGIRTGVVSNLCFAKENLMTRLARYLPSHRFDPVAASSELLFRKPEAFIFNYALRAANLTPADVWFVGDNPTADILGASEVGMRPILYTGAHMRDFDEPIAVPHTRIDDLAELIRLVDEA